MLLAKSKLALGLGTVIFCLASQWPVERVKASNSGFVSAAMKMPKIRLPSMGKPSSTGRSSSANRKEMRRKGDLVKAAIAEIITFNANHRPFYGDEQKASKEAAQQLEVYRAKIAQLLTPELISMANDASNNYAVRAGKRADSYATATARNISNTNLSRIKTGGNHGGLTMARYFTVAFTQEKLRQLQKLYPGRESIGPPIAVVDAAMAELGSVGEVQADRAAAKAAKIAAERISPAAQRNAALERQFTAAFKRSRWTQKEFAGSQVLRVNLTSTGWSVERHRVTGIILTRDRQADLGVKRRDGKCFSYFIVFEQKHQGGGRYGGAYTKSGSEQEMLCKNVPK